MPKLTSSRVRRQDVRGKALRGQRVHGKSLEHVMNAIRNKGNTARARVG